MTSLDFLWCFEWLGSLLSFLANFCLAAVTLGLTKVEGVALLELWEDLALDPLLWLVPGGPEVFVGAVPWIELERGDLFRFLMVLRVAGFFVGLGFSLFSSFFSFLFG